MVKLYKINTNQIFNTIKHSQINIMNESNEFYKERLDGYNHTYTNRIYSNNLFYGVKLKKTRGGSFAILSIDESVPEVMTQILFIISQRIEPKNNMNRYDMITDVNITEILINKWIESDMSIYRDNTTVFGGLINTFPCSVTSFLNTFCDIIEE